MVEDVGHGGSGKAKKKAKVGHGGSGKGKKKWSIGVEWSRSQVMARAGFGGPGSARELQFSKKDEVPMQKKKAAAWLRSQECTM